MSVVVRMEMPECCDECPMEYDGFMCGAIHKRFYPKRDGCYLDPLIDPSKERLPDCPILCQLPEGHGRLVDAEELSKYWKCRIALMNSCSGKRGILESVEASTLKSCIEDIGNSKTIVPAERKDNGETC